MEKTKPYPIRSKVRSLSFMLDCPNCGKRNVSEFSFSGEFRSRPKASAPLIQWVDYVYFKENLKDYGFR